MVTGNANKDLPQYFVLIDRAIALARALLPKYPQYAQQLCHLLSHLYLVRSHARNSLTGGPDSGYNRWLSEQWQMETWGAAFTPLFKAALAVGEYETEFFNKSQR